MQRKRGKKTKELRCFQRGDYPVLVHPHDRGVSRADPTGKNPCKDAPSCVAGPVSYPAGNGRRKWFGRGPPASATSLTTSTGSSFEVPRVDAKAAQTTPAGRLRSKTVHCRQNGGRLIVTPGSPPQSCDYLFVAVSGLCVTSPKSGHGGSSTSCHSDSIANTLTLCRAARPEACRRRTGLLLGGYRRVAQGREKRVPVRAARRTQTCAPGSNFSKRSFGHVSNNPGPAMRQQCLSRSTACVIADGGRAWAPGTLQRALQTGFRRGVQQCPAASGRVCCDTAEGTCTRFVCACRADGSWQAVRNGPCSGRARAGHGENVRARPELRADRWIRWGRADPLPCVGREWRNGGELHGSAAAWPDRWPFVPQGAPSGLLKHGGRCRDTAEAARARRCVPNDGFRPGGTKCRCVGPEQRHGGKMHGLRRWRAPDRRLRGRRHECRAVAAHVSGSRELPQARRGKVAPKRLRHGGTQCRAFGPEACDVAERCTGSAAQLSNRHLRDGGPAVPCVGGACERTGEPHGLGRRLRQINFRHAGGKQCPCVGRRVRYRAEGAYRPAADVHRIRLQLRVGTARAVRRPACAINGELYRLSGRLGGSTD